MAMLPPWYTTVNTAKPKHRKVTATSDLAYDKDRAQKLRDGFYDKPKRKRAKARHVATQTLAIEQETERLRARLFTPAIEAHAAQAKHVATLFEPSEHDKVVEAVTARYRLRYFGTITPPKPVAPTSDKIPGPCTKPVNRERAR